MTKTTTFTIASALMLCLASSASAQTSAPAEARGTIGGKTLSIKYAAPQVRGRQIFGAGGLVSRDSTYPVWRAGANAATTFVTDGDIRLGDLSVPKGTYTLFVDVKDPNAWVLIVNKQTGQWGLTYDAAKDLGRVKMKMTTPSAPVETLKYTITDQGGGKGDLTLAWEKHVAAVPITVQ